MKSQEKPFIFIVASCLMLKNELLFFSLIPVCYDWLFVIYSLYTVFSGYAWCKTCHVFFEVQLISISVVVIAFIISNLHLDVITISVLYSNITENNKAILPPLDVP